MCLKIDAIENDQNLLKLDVMISSRERDFIIFPSVCNRDIHTDKFQNAIYIYGMEVNLVQLYVIISCSGERDILIIFPIG